MDENNPVNQGSFDKEKVEQLKKEMENIESNQTQEVSPQPSQPVQQPEAFDPQPPVVPEVDNLQGLKKSKGILWVALSLLLLAIVGVGAYYLGSNKTTTESTPTTGVSQIPTPTPDSTADWNSYVDNTEFFSFKYPTNVGIISRLNPKDDSPLTLAVSTDFIPEMEDAPLNFTKENAINDMKSLDNGEYGESVGFGLPESKEVITVDGVYAKTFVSYWSGGDACSVNFSRSLVIYHNNHRTILRLAPSMEQRKVITEEAPKYFLFDEPKCGGYTMWDYDNDAQIYFFQDLISGNLSSETANTWYETFDNILATFEFTGDTSSSIMTP